MQIPLIKYVHKFVHLPPIVASMKKKKRRFILACSQCFASLLLSSVCSPLMVGSDTVERTGYYTGYYTGSNFPFKLGGSSVQMSFISDRTSSLSGAYIHKISIKKSISDQNQHRPTGMILILSLAFSKTLCLHTLKAPCAVIINTKYCNFHSRVYQQSLPPPLLQHYVLQNTLI